LKTQRVFLLLGGNQGEVEQTFRLCLSILEKEIGKIVKISSLYQSEAWGPIEQDDFLNTLFVFRTHIPPMLLMKKLLQIESRFGRKREVKYGPRTLDLDILFYGNLILNSEQLTVPHPHIKDRVFALEPLVELSPNFKHPILNKTMQELLSNTTDTLEIKKLKWK
jgi:2-amino-4-hydroxy-6-hydroxymethyldihydropteridine diphosphokinase